MLKISPLKENEIGKALKVIGRAKDALCLEKRISPSIDEDSLCFDLKKKDVVAVKEDNAIIGVACISYSPSSLLCSERAFLDIEDECGVFGEESFFLDYIFIDPMHQDKGNGGRLLEYLLSYRKGEHCYCRIDVFNPCLSFFSKHGFEAIKKEDESFILLRKSVKDGLCRNIRW